MPSHSLYGALSSASSLPGPSRLWFLQGLTLSPETHGECEGDAYELYLNHLTSIRLLKEKKKKRKLQRLPCDWHLLLNLVWVLSSSCFSRWHLSAAMYLWLYCGTHMDRELKKKTININAAPHDTVWSCKTKYNSGARWGVAPASSCFHPHFSFPAPSFLWSPAVTWIYFRSPSVHQVSSNYTILCLVGYRDSEATCYLMASRLATMKTEVSVHLSFL